LSIDLGKWFGDEGEHDEHRRHRKEKKEKSTTPMFTVEKDRESESSPYEIIVDTSSTSLSSNGTENCDEIEVQYEVSLNRGERRRIRD
jgi:hypothetical protein